jgi:type II secretory pathway pseudopilin PulG
VGTVEVKNLSWSNVVAPVIVAIVVGILSSYVTTQVQIGTMQTRLQRAEEDITRLRTQTQTRRKANQELRDRIIRVSTKIDLLLQSEGISTDDISQAQ